jgi:signal peptidase I
VTDPLWAPPAAVASDQSRHWLLPTLTTIGAFVVLSIMSIALMREFALRAYYIPSGSMEPTLHVGTYVLDNRLAYTGNSPARGDIVIFEQPPSFEAAPAPGEASLRFVKRVVAVGGDVISCCDDQNRIVVNGHGITEPFAEGATLPFHAQHIPAHSVFVLGDHRNMSADSRAYGPIPNSRVDGRVVGPHGKIVRLAVIAAGAYAGLLLTAFGWVMLLLSPRRR